MSIDASGNVGIGTTSPDTKLHFYEASAVPVFTIESAAVGQSNYITYRNPNSGGDVYVGMDGNGLFGFSTGSLALGTGNSHIIFAPNYSTGEKMRIDTSGNVGIGVTTVNAKLHVETTGSADVARFFRPNATSGSPTTIHLGRNAATNDTAQFRYVYGGSTNNSNSRIDLGFYGNGSILNITAGRKVGIDNTSPSYKLDVNGDINVSSGSFRINGTPLANSATIAANVSNHANEIVRRDGTGSFNAGVITASLNGNASSASNADTVDGLHASSFLRSDIGGTVSGLITAKRVKPYSGSYSAYYDSAAIEVREYALQGTGGADTSYARAPRIGFHWSGRVASQLVLENSGRISVLNNPGNAYEQFGCGYIYNSGGAYFGDRVGIGASAPKAWLHVAGAAYLTLGNYNSQYSFSYSYQGGWHHQHSPGTATFNWGIYTNYYIGTSSGFVHHAASFSASDERIKKNIVDADDAECLETLRLLKPKKYQYRDFIKRGEEPVWGFIAQEVKETLPYATKFIQEVLPNIYELASVSSSNVITFTEFNTSDLESNATTVIRISGINGEDHDLHLAEIIDAHTIRVEEDLTEWTGSVDSEGNIIGEITTTTITPEEYEVLEDTSGYVANISGYQNANVSISVEEYNALEDTTGYKQVVQDYTKTCTTYHGNQLFVHGQEVDDFVFIQKEAIWTVATAALQEVDRQQQADKARIAELESRITELEGMVSLIKNNMTWPDE